MKTLKLIGLGILAFYINAFAGETEPILGFWINEDENVKVEIYKSEELYYGKIVWVKEHNEDMPQTDENNPDPKKKNNPVIGLQVITGLKYNPEKNFFQDGKIYTPQNGREANLKIRFTDPNTLELVMSSGIFSRKIHWKRAQS